jgi:hypothetical protein
MGSGIAIQRFRVCGHLSRLATITPRRALSTRMIGADSTNLGARVQSRSTLVTIALNTGLPFGKDKLGGS